MTWISSAGKISRKADPVRNRGFTLIEMIAVMALIGLFLVLAAPVAFSTLDRIQRDSSVRQMASSLAAVRSQAVAEKTTYLFQGDLDLNQYWMSDPETGENSNTVQLDPKIRFREFQNGDESLNEGIFSIAFYPLGSTSGGTIFLEAVDDNSASPSFLLTVDPVTGKPYLQHAS